MWVATRVHFFIGGRPGASSLCPVLCTYFFHNHHCILLASVIASHTIPDLFWSSLPWMNQYLNRIVIWYVSSFAINHFMLLIIENSSLLSWCSRSRERRHLLSTDVATGLMKKDKMTRRMRNNHRIRIKGKEGNEMKVHSDCPCFTKQHTPSSSSFSSSNFFFPSSSWQRSFSQEVD